MTGDPGPDPASRREVRVIRVFRAPREVVFDAWIDPDQVAAWMAPEGCEVPRESVVVDPRAGGRIHYSMVDPARAATYRVRFEIVEIAAPELLVLTSEPDLEIGLPHPMLTRVTFDIDGDGTRVTVTQGPHTHEMQREAERGWLSSFDKLEQALGS
jgi:uncharacterized protein YndB with AHSA1/START domain